MVYKMKVVEEKKSITLRRLRQLRKYALYSDGGSIYRCRSRRDIFRNRHKRLRIDRYMRPKPDLLCRRRHGGAHVVKHFSNQIIAT